VVENFKEIAEHIKEHLEGCKFVGISQDNEVFVECAYDDEEMQNGTALYLQAKFPYISKVIVVVKPALEDVKQMVDGLNKFLDDTQPKKGDLLDIGRF
jgi:hypothetical protein